MMVTKGVKDLIINIVLGLLLPIHISVVLLLPILLTPGIPFYGDNMYYFLRKDSYYFTNLLELWLSSYFPGVGGVSSTMTLAYVTILTSLVNILGPEWGVKFFMILGGSLPGIITYFSLLILSRDFRIFRRRVSSLLFSTLGSLITLISFTNSGILNGADTLSFVYAAYPALVLFTIRYLIRGSLWDLLLLGIFSILASAQPFWIFLEAITLIISPLLVLNRIGFITFLRRASIIVISLVGFNSLWVLPTSSGYILGAGNVFELYTTERSVTFGGLLFLSHWRLLDVMLIGERSYHFFWDHPQTIGPLNVSIPLLAGLAVAAWGRKSRIVLFFSILLVMGIFLTKGAHEPGGQIYYYIVSNLPYGLGAHLRNPTKFVPLVVFSYSFLVSFSAVKLAESLSTSRRMIHRIAKYLVPGIVILIVLIALLSGTVADLRKYTWNVFNPVQVPEAYEKVNEWLSSQGSEPFKAAWIPMGRAYVWKPYIITAFPLYLSSMPAVPTYDLIDKLGYPDQACQILSYLGVRYLLFHNDSLSPPYGWPSDAMYSNLTKLPCLTKVFEYSSSIELQDLSGAGRPSDGDNIYGLRVQTGNVPLKVIQPADRELAKGNNSIVIFYQIPDYIAKQGFKGKFWAGFNIRLWAIKPGSPKDSPYTERYAEAFVAEQMMINDTIGYAKFYLDLSRYPYKHVDLFASIYDGGYKPLSPLYYLGRYFIKEEAVITIKVFENKDYRGSVFIENGSARILSYKRVSPFMWSLEIYAETPFTLVLSEPYDRLWRIVSGGVDTIPHRCWGVNCFFINQTGLLHLTIYYSLQRYTYAGTMFSLAAFVLILSAALLKDSPLAKHLSRLSRSTQRSAFQI